VLREKRGEERVSMVSDSIEQAVWEDITAREHWGSSG
jgi:hypothetical protein